MEKLFEIICPKCGTKIQGELKKDAILNGKDVEYACPKCGFTLKHPDDIKVEKVVT